MAYDDPGDTKEEDKGALFAFGMYLRSSGDPLPSSGVAVRAGWKFADEIKSTIRRYPGYPKGVGPL